MAEVNAMRRQSGYTFHNKSSWFVRFMDDVLENGTIVRKLVCKKIEEVSYGGEYRTRKSVQPFVDKILAPLNAGLLNPQSTQTVLRFVEDIYLPRYVDVELRPASRKQFRDTWTNHIKPRVGQHTLRSFRTVDAQRILDAIAAKGTLGRSSMRHCKSALSGIFKEAKRLGIIDGVNPVADTRIGKTRESEEDTYAYSLAEVKLMLARLPEPARTIVLTAAFSGLRRSEILGLRWADFDGSTITVRRSRWNGFETDPKTKKSRAPIPVVKALADALDAHKVRQGSLAQDELPIFQCGNGKPLNLPNLARRVVRPAVERCIRCQQPASEHKPESHMFELDRSCAWHGWHAFRRGLATNLHTLGVDDKTIQAILRHSNVTLTMNTYVKSVNESQVNALDALREEFETCNELTTPSAARPN
jgi:integrase